MNNKINYLILLSYLGSDKLFEFFGLSLNSQMTIFL